MEREKRREAEDVQSGHRGQIESKRTDGRGHRSEGGIAQAARELNIPRKMVERAVAAESLAPEGIGNRNRRGCPGPTVCAGWPPP